MIFVFKDTRMLIKWLTIFNIANIIIAAVVGQLQTEYLIRRINKNTNRNKN
jgi:hypothetical protein